MKPRPEADAPPSRPSLLDHLAVLAGVALSVYLMRLAPLSAVPANDLSPRAAQAFDFLVVLIRLGEGIVLLWPLFFVTQWFGRSDGLTAGEWLWLLCWVGVLLLTAFAAWGRVLGYPEAIAPHADKPRILWYSLVTPALAALALVVLVVDLFRDYVPPWTHHLGLALLLWPAPAALVVLLGGELRPEWIMHVLGLDVGGANLKVVHTNGRAATRAFALWKAPQRLRDELNALVAGAPAFDRLALTMTAELCDCFESKREGVGHVLDAAEAVAGGKPVWVWTNAGAFVSSAEARADPLPAASANWLAQASYFGRAAPVGPALLIDVGTTTTDVVPLLDGVPMPAGRTDAERFACGELVYVGWRRTPLCALAGVSRAAEFYATTLDAYLLLGVVDDLPNDRDTADGRPATREAANRRLARMLGGDLETTTQQQRDDFAAEIDAKVCGLIATAVGQACVRLSGPPRAVVASGTGETLVRRALASFPPLAADFRFVSLAQEAGEAGSAAACAYAVALLCQEMA